jgi:hypothetical protein
VKSAAEVARRRADRALCPVEVANALGLQVCKVAAAMRTEGVTERLTLEQGRAWRSMSEQPPTWILALMVTSAARAASREAEAQRRDVEDEHRMLLLAADVEERLLSSRTIRGEDREFIASDYAFRAMKDLVRADGDVGYLNDLDLAALRWAGVVPSDRSTWFIRAGGDIR